MRCIRRSPTGHVKASYCSIRIGRLQTPLNNFHSEHHEVTKNYFVQRACAKVKGLNDFHKRLAKKTFVSEKSTGTLYNYMRCIAQVSLTDNACQLSWTSKRSRIICSTLRKRVPWNLTLSSLCKGFGFCSAGEGLDDRAIRLPQLPSNSTSRWTPFLLLMTGYYSFPLTELKSTPLNSMYAPKFESLKVTYLFRSY